MCRVESVEYIADEPINSLCRAKIPLTELYKQSMTIIREILVPVGDPGLRQ